MYACIFPCILPHIARMCTCVCECRVDLMVHPVTFDKNNVAIEVVALISMYAYLCV